MRFTVAINGKKYPVYVMKEPSSSLALSNFDYEGKSYKGSPEQFNGLRFDKGKNRYIATSISVLENAKAPIESISEIAIEPEEAQEIVESIIEEEQIVPINIDLEILPVPTTVSVTISDEEQVEQIEEIEEIDDITEANELEESIESRKQEFLTQIMEESEKLKKITTHALSGEEITHVNGQKKYRFAPRWQYLFPDNTSWASDFFERQKMVWIKMHGSEHLRIASDMKCKCDSLYIQERAGFDFPLWALHENLSFYELESPDFGVLTFLKNFKNMYKDLFNEYRSRVTLGTTEENDNEDYPLVIVSDYLCHADLTIPLVNLVDQYGDKC